MFQISSKYIQIHNTFSSFTSSIKNIILILIFYNTPENFLLCPKNFSFTLVNDYLALDRTALKFEKQFLGRFLDCGLNLPIFN